MNFFNTCQAAAVLPASFLSPGKPLIPYPEEILEKYNCKSYTSLQFHLGECCALNEWQGKGQNKTVSQRILMCVQGLIVCM